MTQAQHRALTSPSPSCGLFTDYVCVGWGRELDKYRPKSIPSDFARHSSCGGRVGSRLLQRPPDDTEHPGGRETLGRAPRLLCLWAMD